MLDVGGALERLIKNPPVAVVIFAAGGLLALTALADSLADRSIGLEVFYLIPILIAAWYLDRAWALGIACLAAVAWLLLDLVDPPALWDPLVSAWNGASRLLMFVGTAFVVSALRESLRSARGLTRVDELTGAKNPPAFYEAARTEIDRMRRAGAPLTVAFLDVGGFDEVESGQGGGAADRLLKVVASATSEIVRSTDTMARLHDDEFGIIFPETDRIEAGAVLLKVSEYVRDALRENQWPAQLRVGAVTFLTPPDSVNDMRRVMEEALHAARQQGPDVVEHQVIG